ncbi:MAG: HEAT repeat domain-containing protein [Eubacteriales bacterium]|nr:HEAT repeat domain-containing protein [Eubacteriales bacterium]
MGKDTLLTHVIKLLFAFIIGAAVFVIVCVLFISVFIPDLMSVPIPKYIWYIGLFIGGAFGIGIGELNDKPYHAKSRSQRRSGPDEAALRKNKDKIIADLKNEDADKRAEAMTNLAILHDLDAVPLLIPGLQDPDQMVRLRATEALTWITGQDFGEDEEKWNEWWAHSKQAQNSFPKDPYNDKNNDIA